MGASRPLPCTGQRYVASGLLRGRGWGGTLRLCVLGAGHDRTPQGCHGAHPRGLHGGHPGGAGQEESQLAVLCLERCPPHGPLLSCWLEFIIKGGFRSLTPVVSLLNGERGVPAGNPFPTCSCLELKTAVASTEALRPVPPALQTPPSPSPALPLSFQDCAEALG